MLDEPPVRLCCHQRHWGAICPDGKVMCQLCYDRFELTDLHTDEGGTPEDVCKECAERERLFLESLKLPPIEGWKASTSQLRRLFEQTSDS